MNETREAEAGRLIVQVLGPFQIERQRTRVRLGSPRQQAVLLPLVLRPGRVIGQEEILDGVWGEAVPASGMALVRTYVSRLRAILGQHVIVRCGAGYYVQLDPGQVDLTVFEQQVTEARSLRRHGQLGPSAMAWRRALDLWQGPPLLGITGPFAERQRQRLADVHLSTLEECWGTEILLGRHAELMVELSSVMRDQPLRESVTELFMLAAHRSGRQADAIAAFELTRRRLIKELGLQPAPRLQLLYDRIRSGDPELM